MASNDLVVVLPGIMGSTLRRQGSLVWAPSAGSVVRAIRTFGRSIKELRLPDGIGDERPDDGVEPGGLMPDLHALPGIWTPVKGYDVLVTELRKLGYREGVDAPGAPPGNLLPLAYDWRLSNRYNARRLARIVEPALERWRAHDLRNADARVVFVCHSMGGLVARWYVERCGGVETTRKLITLGTPYRGSAKALVQLVNGMRRGVGRLSVDLSELMLSFPSCYELLPAYACVDFGGQLVGVAETPLPELRTAMVTDAVAFHAALAAAEQLRPASLSMTHAIIGTRQPTSTTVRLTAGRAVPLDTYAAEDHGGDSTVPLIGAVRGDVDLDSNTLRRVPDKHGNLHRNSAALDEIRDLLTGPAGKRRAGVGVAVEVRAPDFLTVGEPLLVECRLPHGERLAVRVVVTDETGALVESRVLRPSGETDATTITGLAPGAYTIDVTGPVPSPIQPVSCDLLVWSE